MSAPDKVHDLLERFERNLPAYKQGQYNETQVRREFIDPLFGALGWDVANVKGYAEAYKDVVHEDAIKVAGGTKAPDYSFRIGGARKFFVEAKKPSVDIRNDVHPAYQLRRYAWSAKLPLCILTDFEELAVYDCRVRPDKGDKSSTARMMYLGFQEYAERWDEIAGVFSREAILRGSFDRYVEEKGSKRGTAEVDAAFLAEIERWRDLLARNIALRNPAHQPAVAELRRPVHHRPADLPAHLRGPGHRAVRHAAEPDQRRAGLRAAGAAVPPRRRPLQLGAVSLRAMKRAAASRPTH